MKSSPSTCPLLNIQTSSEREHEVLVLYIREHVLKNYFIEELHEKVRFVMRNHGKEQKDATSQTIAPCATSLINL